MFSYESYVEFKNIFSSKFNHIMELYGDLLDEVRNKMGAEGEAILLTLMIRDMIRICKLPPATLVGILETIKLTAMHSILVLAEVRSVDHDYY